MMNAAEVMTRSVLTVNREDSLSDGIQLMLQYGISGLPVVDETGRPVGMLTEGDLLRRAEMHTEHQRPRWLEFLLGPDKLANEYIHTHSRRVKDVMTPKVIAVAPDAPLKDVVRLMERHHVKRIPVLEGGHVVGIISRANLLHILSVVAGDIPQSAPSDEEIRTRLWNELDKVAWAPASSINIFVRDGVVYLSGTVSNGRECDALRVAAENIPGVKAVHSDLVWCDAMTGSVIELPEEENLAPRREKH